MGQNREAKVSFFQPGYATAEQKPHLSRKRHARAARVSRAAGATMQEQRAMSAGFGSTGLIAEARRYLGGNPTGRSSLWCANFMNMVLQRSGYRTTGSNLARSFASYGQRVSGPQVGAIAVMSRGKRGGHVGVVSGFDKNGNPIVISGNHGGRVAEAVYPRGRIYAYVMPTS
ncbi:MAG: TIGR02594 family protein [Pseudorhodoplanes sp.]|nr:TIGR02594 family protein [Pseudorhodoplanes sp.]